MRRLYEQLVNDECIRGFLSYRYRRQSHRGDRIGQLSTHGPSEDRTPGVWKTTGSVQQRHHHDHENVPHADRRRTVDAGPVHGEIIEENVGGAITFLVKVQTLSGLKFMKIIFSSAIVFSRFLPIAFSEH